MAQDDQGVAPLVLRLFARQDLLQQPNDGAPFGRPVLFVRVELVQHIECAHRVEEVPHELAVVGDHDQESLVVGRAHVLVQLPGQLRLAVHNMASCQPAQLHWVHALILVLDVQKRLFGILEVTRAGQRNALVPVEIVVVLQELRDRGLVNQHVFELARDEKAAAHALPAGNGVALGHAAADQLEVLLRDAQLLLWVAVELALPHNGVHYRFQNVLSGVLGF